MRNYEIEKIYHLKIRGIEENSNVKVNKNEAKTLNL